MCHDNILLNNILPYIPILRFKQSFMQHFHRAKSI
jgi:hypothetical protein